MTFVFLAFAAVALVHNHLRGQGLVLAGLALIPVVVVDRMRLRTDDSGVTVVNLLGPRHVPWSEINDFRLGRSA
ncbi:MAG: PH domain-containing protein [Actinomycetota bacterium]